MNLFDKQDFEKLSNRIQTVSENSERQWGNLTHAQMLAHCRKVLEVAIQPYKRQFLIGMLFGKTVVNNILNNKDEMKKGIKSSKKLFEENPSSFEEEKLLLMQTFQQFHDKGGNFYENKLHPFFGRLTTENWSSITYKHLNHHLSQFSC